MHSLLVPARSDYSRRVRRFRSLLAGLLIAAFVPTCDAALTYADILGTWKGTRTEYFNGKAVSGSQVLLLRKLQNGGFSGTTTMSFPGIGTITASGRYFAGGGYESTAYFNGQVISTADGTWTLSNTTIRVKAHVQAIDGASSATALLRFVNQRTLVAVSSQSNGGRVSITLHRR